MPAPIGNKNAVGNNGGRPPIHTDPAYVEKLIKDYFEWIDGEFEIQEEKYIDAEGNTRTRKEKVWIRHPEPPTITGLTLHLGFNSKTSLYEYAEKVEFMDSIKRAISRIEKYHEIQAAQRDKPTGNIFILKNFGWADRSEIDHTTKGKRIGARFDLNDLTDDQIEALMILHGKDARDSD